ncbi:xylan 1,4-beta-xylosidase [Streptomyces sp. NPDC057136]|uniref:GH39 family glycosyl hydrolase n=1 Tax=Streptomyces sp. NPDC057136 TaxID=3346029 RepID=UPI00362AC4EE
MFDTSQARKAPGTGPHRRWRIALLAATAIALALVLSLCATLPSGRDTSTRGTDAWGAPAEPSLGWGLTHTQYSADAGDPGAKETARRALSARSLPQNQHIMGWGANNPEPSPGRYDFAALDSRIGLIRETGGTPVITLCCAPDWMKGGRPGHTDWSRRSLETAPRPEHYDDFAALAATVAERYPDVRHFIVWNEFKGFFDDSRKRWNYEGYTELYNKVHQALKKVNKNNLVGGPYLNMDSFAPGRTSHASILKGPWGSVDQRVLDAFDYWNTHKAGADFAVVDGSSYTHDDGTPPDQFRSVDKFTAIGRWVQERTSLPLWWAEYYVEPGADSDRDRWSESHRKALQAAGMAAMVRGGATTGFYWNPQKRGGQCYGCLWRSTELTDGSGGAPLPMLDLVRRFHSEFPPGTTYRPVDVASDAPNVRVLADDKVVLVVNTLDRAVRAEIDGRTVNMDAYEVLWLRRP